MVNMLLGVHAGLSDVFAYRGSHLEFRHGSCFEEEGGGNIPGTLGEDALVSTCCCVRLGTGVHVDLV